MKPIDLTVKTGDVYNRNFIVKEGYFYYDIGLNWQYKTLWRVNLETRVEELIDYRGNIT